MLNVCASYRKLAYVWVRRSSTYRISAATARRSFAASSTTSKRRFLRKFIWAWTIRPLARRNSFATGSPSGSDACPPDAYQRVSDQSGRAILYQSIWQADQAQRPPLNLRTRSRHRHLHQCVNADPMPSNRQVGYRYSGLNRTLLPRPLKTARTNRPKSPELWNGDATLCWSEVDPGSGCHRDVSAQYNRAAGGIPGRRTFPRDYCCLRPEVDQRRMR